MSRPVRAGLGAAGVRAGLAATAAGVVVLAGCAAPQETATAPGGAAARVVVPDDGDGLAGAVLDEPYVVPPVTLLDTAGRPFHLVRDTTAPVTVVFFGYTSCPDVCSAVLADTAAALRRVPEPARQRVQLVFVTTDPARDDPATIRDYLDRFDPSFVGLTGELPAIERAARALGVALEGITRLPGGGYEVGHGAQLVGVDAHDRGHIVWTTGTTIGDLRADLTRLAGG